jgi:hypothetical protein
MIDIAADTGMPVKLGAKYSAEHQSLGYNQADIRELEIPRRRSRMANGPLYASADGARLIHALRLWLTFFQEGSPLSRCSFACGRERSGTCSLAIRRWPRPFGRTASFLRRGWPRHLMEPLTFKGREGSGLPGGRCAYADASLNPNGRLEKNLNTTIGCGAGSLYDPRRRPGDLRADF